MEVEITSQTQIPDIQMSNDQKQESTFSFSDLVDHNGRKVLWSPDGLFLASYSRDTLFVRERNDLNVLVTQKMPDRIESIEWSPNSSLILCLIKRKNLIVVFVSCWILKCLLIPRSPPSSTPTTSSKFLLAMKASLMPPSLLTVLMSLPSLNFSFAQQSIPSVPLCRGTNFFVGSIGS